MRSLPLLAVVTAASVFLAGCGGKPSDSGAKVNCADLVSNANGTNAAHTKIQVDTTKGTFKVELFDDASPITTKNFKTYVEEKYYDHVVFHRIVKDFMMQGGKFDNTTKSAKTPSHGQIKNEAKTSGCLNKEYTLSMARTNEPDSASTEFFVNFKDNAFLDPSANNPHGYAVFGIVYEGLDVVQSIEQVPVHVMTSSDKMCQPEGSTANCPNTPVEMNLLTVI